MCSDQGAPGNHQLQAQRKEIRGLVAPSDPTPGSPPPHSSSQSPDCMKPPGAPEQRARLPGAVEPLSRQASLLHNANNQLSQDRELGPDLRSLTSVLHMWPKEAPRGLNRWDSTGPEPVPQLWQVLPALSLAHCRARCGRDYRLDVSPSGQDMTCGNKGAISSPPQAFSHEKAGRQSNSLEQVRAPCQSLLLQGVPLTQEAAGMVLPPCLSGPHRWNQDLVGCGSSGRSSGARGEGWDQVTE